MQQLSCFTCADTRRPHGLPSTAPSTKPLSRQVPTPSRVQAADVLGKYFPSAAPSPLQGLLAPGTTPVNNTHTPPRSNGDTPSSTVTPRRGTPIRRHQLFVSPGPACRSPHLQQTVLVSTTPHSDVAAQHRNAHARPLTPTRQQNTAPSTSPLQRKTLTPHKPISRKPEPVVGTPRQGHVAASYRQPSVSHSVRQVVNNKADVPSVSLQRIVESLSTAQEQCPEPSQMSLQVSLLPSHVVMPSASVFKFK